MQIEQIVLDSNTRNHLTLRKQQIAIVKPFHCVQTNELWFV